MVPREIQSTSIGEIKAMAMRAQAANILTHGEYKKIAADVEVWAEEQGLKMYKSADVVRFANKLQEQLQKAQEEKTQKYRGSQS